MSAGPAIGFLETSSIAKGVEATDAILKKAQVELLLTSIVPRGKYLVMFGGAVADVQQSLEAGIEHLRVHPEGDAFELVAAESGLDLDDLDVRWYPDRHMFFGGVAGASLIGGHLDSHADSRRVGAAIVVD